MTHEEAIHFLKNDGRECCLYQFDSPIKCTMDDCEIKIAHLIVIEALENQKWHKTSEEKPTEEKQYLCCDVYNGKHFFKVLWWSNNLYEVDDFDFYNRNGECGFWKHDSEYGYLESFCTYWKPIDWSD